MAMLSYCNDCLYAGAAGVGGTRAVANICIHTHNQGDPQEAANRNWKVDNFMILLTAQPKSWVCSHKCVESCK